ncbi:hypothetical protein JHW43_000274 [Diplocarpon mali]|nr:hypothetical protein JHW43_000274 [Diplocarpon mali]
MICSRVARSRSARGWTMPMRRRPGRSRAVQRGTGRLESGGGGGIEREREIRTWPTRGSSPTPGQGKA